MRDYEMVELKLSVALDEGIAGRGLAPSSGRFCVERLMPGLYALGVPTAGHSLKFVVLTDEYDLTLLGIGTDTSKGILLLHERDIAVAAEHGLEIETSGFTRREPMPGWLFCSFPWRDVAAMETVLRMLLPAYQATELPAGLFSDC